MDLRGYEQFTQGYERRIELINGFLLSGNRSAGNKALLALLLESWGPESVLPFADPKVWWQALQDHTPKGFTATPLEINLTRSALREHNDLRQKLELDLFASAPDDAHVYGRDVVMKLGENAPTPDLFIATPHLNTPMSSYYLGGPADIAIEVLAEGEDNACFEKQLKLYLTHGVAEVWAIDVATKEARVHARTGQRTIKGTLISQAVTGLSVNLETLFSEAHESCVRWQRSWVESESKTSKGVSYGDLPFTPRVGLEPERITFDEFIAWSPESKLELLDGKVIASGLEGTRNLVGMLAMTLGASETVRLLPGEVWVQALETYTPEYHEQRWQTALGKLTALARDIKARLELQRVYVSGDILNANEWNFWSQVELIVPELGREGMLQLYEMSRVYFDSLELALYGKEDDLDALLSKAVVVQ